MDGFCHVAVVTVDGHDRGFLHVYFDVTPVLESGDGVHEVLYLGVCLGEAGEIVRICEVVEGVNVGEDTGVIFLWSVQLP